MTKGYSPELGHPGASRDQQARFRRPRGETSMREQRTEPANRTVFLGERSGRNDARDVIKPIDEPEQLDMEQLYTKLASDFLKEFALGVSGGRGVRIEGARFQNRLLRIAYQNLKDFSLRDMQDAILQMAERSKNPLVQRSRDEIPGVLALHMRGVEVVLAYVQNREKKFASAEQNKEKRLAIGTNDELDARHKIDLVEVVGSDESGAIDEVRLVQIKSGAANIRESDSVYQAHADYVSSLRTGTEQEREARMHRGSDGLFEFKQELKEKEMPERFVAYMDRYADIFLQTLLFCKEHSGNPSNEEVVSWFAYVHEGVSKEELEKHVAEFAFLVRTPHSEELFRLFAISVGEEDPDRTVQLYQSNIRSWARSYEPSLSTLRELTGEYDPDPQWVTRDSVRFVSVYWAGGESTEKEITI